MLTCGPQHAASRPDSADPEELESFESDISLRPRVRLHPAARKRLSFSSTSPPPRSSVRHGLSESRWPLQGALREVYLWGINQGKAGGGNEDGEGVVHVPDIAVRGYAGGTVRGRARRITPRVEYTAEDDRAMKDYYCMHCTRCMERQSGWSTGRC